MSDQILVVDDEKDAVDSIVLAFQLRKMTCRGETDPRVAIESFRANPTDVVIVDYLFPSSIEMTGIEVIAQLQAIKPFTTFILVSGWDYKRYDEKSLTEDLQQILKADRFLKKPLDIDKLVETVKSALQTIESQSKDWKAIAQEYIRKGEVRPEEVQKLNENVKDSLIIATDKTREELQ